MTPRRPRGFVLLEAVVALAILGVASIVLLQVRAQQIRVATQARELLTAQALAEDRIAAVKLLDYLLLADPPDSILAGVFPTPFEEFSWRTEIALMEEEYDLFGVEVEVLGPVERFPLRTMVHRARPVLGGAEGGAGGVTQGRGAGRLGSGRGSQTGGRVGSERGTGGERGGIRGGVQRGGAGGRGGAPVRPGGEAPDSGGGR